MKELRRNPHIGGRRVGLIVPALNDVVEPECVWMAPPGMSFHSTRVYMKETTAADLRSMNSETRNAARLLAAIKPDVVAYACTAASFLDGEDASRAIEHDIARELDCPVVTTSGAMIGAFRSLGLKRIALATPYPEDVTAAEERYISRSGFEVVSSRCLGYSGHVITQVPHAEIASLVRSANHGSADAIFVSCTGFRALELAQGLEDELGKPVLTSNQVTFWGVLRALRYEGAITGFGRVLAAPAAAS